MPRDESTQLTVLDASVAVRWVVSEEGSAEAAELLERELTWIAPRLLNDRGSIGAPAEGG